MLQNDFFPYYCQILYLSLPYPFGVFMSNVISSCLPVSVLLSSSSNDLDEVKKQDWHTYVLSSLSVLRPYPVTSSDTLFQSVLEACNLWQNDDFIYPFIVSDWDDNISLVWRVNNVCLEITRVSSFEYKAVMYNAEDLANEAKLVEVDCNRMVTEIENFFITSSTLLRDAGIDWHAYLVR